MKKTISAIQIQEEEIELTEFYGNNLPKREYILFDGLDSTAVQHILSFVKYFTDIVSMSQTNKLFHECVENVKTWDALNERHFRQTGTKRDFILRYLRSFEEPPLHEFKWHDSKIYQNYGIKQEYTISLCGEDGVGKTTFLTIFFNVSDNLVGNV
jgi:flagellar biosynthesis GTPase FlhF